MSTLDDLRAKGLLESVEADSGTAARWLKDAERHLEAAETIADMDESADYALTYDAARRRCGST